MISKQRLLVDAFILKLGGNDLFLGVEWLETLGENRIDWKRMTLSSDQEGRKVVLREYHICDQHLSSQGLESGLGQRLCE